MMKLATPTIGMLKIKLENQKEIWVPQSELEQGLYPRALLLHTGGKYNKVPKFDLQFFSDETIKLLRNRLVRDEFRSPIIYAEPNGD